MWTSVHICLSRMSCFPIDVIMNDSSFVYMCVCVDICNFFISDEILQLNGEWSLSSNIPCALGPHACRLFLLVCMHRCMGGAPLYARMV